MAASERRLGPEHPYTFTSVNNLAALRHKISSKQSSLAHEPCDAVPADRAGCSPRNRGIRPFPRE